MALETLKADARIASYATQSKDAGLPRDQLERFIAGGYFAFPKILPFHAAARLADRSDGPDEIALGGTRYFGKTHSVMAQVGLDDCQRVPGLKYLFLRKIMKSAGESLEDVVYQVFRYVPHTLTEGRLDFPNGSRILIGGFNNENDIDKYLGINYDGVIIEEATQLSASKMDKIYGSIRTAHPGWRARKYMTSNPDGIGLRWFKDKFVLPWRKVQERWTRFFNCHWRDNPLAKPEYIRYLQSLTGPLAKAWRDGDWDAFEGMALPNWRDDLHIIDPFEIPAWWPKWRAVDWGYASPFCAGWFTQDPDTTRIYAYQDAVHTHLTDAQQARLIRDNTHPDHKILLTYADPSMFNKTAKNQGIVYCTADEYKLNGVPLTPADNDRLSGKRKVDRLLANLPDGKPGIQFFRVCTYLTTSLPALALDKNRPEDVDTTQDDHGYDMARYALTKVRMPSLPQPGMKQPADNRPPLTRIAHL